MNVSKKLRTWLANGVSFIKRNSGILIGLIIMVVFLVMTQPVFLKVSNLTNVIRQISVNILLACSMTLVIIIGGIDLSVGSIIAISGCLSAGFITFNGFNSVVANSAVHRYRYQRGCAQWPAGIPDQDPSLHRDLSYHEHRQRPDPCIHPFQDYPGG